MLERDHPARAAILTLACPVRDAGPVDARDARNLVRSAKSVDYASCWFHGLL